MIHEFIYKKNININAAYSISLRIEKLLQKHFFDTSTLSEDIPTL